MTVCITTQVDTSVSLDALWSALSDIQSHTTWMADAVDIRFVGFQHTGVGTRFVCDTRIGPFSTADELEVVEWVERKRIGVTHSGLFTGTGVFAVSDEGTHRTVTWTEKVTFPLAFGGRLGELIARPIMRRIWQANLRRLTATAESPT